MASNSSTDHEDSDGRPGNDGHEADHAPGAARRGRWEVRVVRGRSMHPTLRDGDRLLVRRTKAGDAAPLPSALVVVRLPGDRPESVKRLLRRDPDGGWWVERDNPLEGVDSWQVGAIPEKDLLGVVIARIWPGPQLLAARPRSAS
jgi:hypothetical protein